MTDELMNMTQLAKYLGVRCSYAYDLIRSGLIQSFLIGGGRKVRRKEVERFLVWAEGKDLSDPYNVKDLEKEDARR